MLTLALECSAKITSAALLEDSALLAEVIHADGMTHSVSLLPLAENLLVEQGYSLKDVNRIAVSHGPGSFTGLRIGLATAKGLSWSREIPALGVSTLEAAAFGAEYREGDFLCCSMDARRSQVFNALFEIKNGKPVRLCEDRALSIEDLLKELETSKKEWLLLGDGAELCYNSAKNMKGLKLAPEKFRHQSARGVALASVGKTFGTADDLLPVYLRLSQAERERQAKMEPLSDSEKEK